MDPVTMAILGAASQVLTNPSVQAGATQAVGEFTPAAMAQRRAFDRAKKRLDTGVGYGMSQAEKNQTATQGNMALASQLSAQQANIARQQAAGALGGGAAAGAQRAVANAAAAGAAQNAAAVQQQSNALSRQQFAEDNARMDEQAERARQFWRDNAARVYKEPIAIDLTGSGLGSSPALTAGVPAGATTPGVAGATGSASNAAAQAAAAKLAGVTR